MESKTGPINLPRIAFIKISVRKRHMYIDCDYGFESRHASIIYLFIQAFNRVRKFIKNDFDFYINTDDYAMDCGTKIFAFGAQKGMPNVELIPDPFFHNWVETHVDVYDHTCKQIAEAGDKPPIHNKLFWIGCTITHPLRKYMVDTYGSYEHFELIGMWWKFGAPGTKNGFDKYVSLIDHTKYKYLIDCVAKGWSGRLKFLMYTKRPLFYVEREIVGFFEPDLKPFVHYIPVKGDLSNLIEMYHWAENNPDICKEIAQNAFNYASTNLTTEAAINKLGEIILKHANQPN